MSAEKNRLIIAIDARPLSKLFTGIGIYTFNLISAMLKLNEHIHFILISDMPISADLFPSNRVTIFSKNINSALAATFWYHFLLPFQIQKFKFNYFWSPRHHLPFFMKNKSWRNVVTIHDVIGKTHPKFLPFLTALKEKIFLPYSVRIADYIVSLSKKTESLLHHFFPKAKNKITTIYPGANRVMSVNNNINKKILFEKLKINKPYLLFIGTLEIRKNLKNLLLAYKKLPRELQKQYQLVIVGAKGWKVDSADLEALQNENKLIITGYLEESEKNCILNNASLFVYPSLEEGFGLPVIEAMLAKIPVLTTPIPATEITDNTVFVCNPQDSSDIAQHLERILENPDYRSAQLEAAYAISQQYTWEKTAAAYLAIFLQR